MTQANYPKLSGFAVALGTVLVGIEGCLSLFGRQGLAGCASQSEAVTVAASYVCVECRMVAQSCTLSESVKIVANHDDFAERGSVSRSTLEAATALDLSKCWAAGKAPAGHRPALLCLWYRRVALCGAPRNSEVWDHPTPCRIQFGDTARYSRLKICATAASPQKAKQILGFSARGSSPQSGRRGVTLEGIDWPLGPSVAPRRISFPPLFRRLISTAPITQSLRDISKGEIRLSSCSYRVLEGIEQL